MLRTLSLFAVLLPLVACDGGEPSTDDLECRDNAGCTGLQACIDNACVDVSCLSNEDCQVGQTCDPDADWSCVEGCSQDNDCLAGQTCDDGTCADGECEDHHIDCAVGQFCAEDGDGCEDVPGFCQACTEGDDSSCPDGFVCHFFDKEKEAYCLLKCDNSAGIDDSQCPARAECFGSGTDSQCLTGCPDLVAIGAI